MEKNFLRTVNHIQTSQPVSWDDDTIRYEVASGMALLNALNLRIFPGDSSLAIDEAIEEMCQIFMDFRDYGIRGKGCGMTVYDAPAMENAIPFVLAARPLASLTQSLIDINDISELQTLSACINSVFARAKLETDHDELGSGPTYYESGVFEDNIVGLILQGLTIYELSLLGGISEQAVRNALQESGAPKKTINRNWYGIVTVDAKEAFEWLKTRAGFKYEGAGEKDGQIAVPIDKRGYFFNTKCRQTAGYKVGEKGSEQYYETFEAALQALTKMKVPRFRRPNQNNRFGIVNGIRWEYKSPKELGLS